MPLLDESSKDPFTTRKKNQTGSGIFSLSPKPQSDWATLGTGKLMNDGTDQSAGGGSKIVSKMLNRNGFGQPDLPDQGNLP